MDALTYVRFAASLVLVLGLMMGLLWVLRRYGPPGMIHRKTGKKRLAVVEAVQVDARRRLLLVSRDGVEHLIMIGPHTDVLVESCITGPETMDFAERLAQSGAEAAPQENKA